jgi:PAS domain S-box-containing protein
LARIQKLEETVLADTLIGLAERLPEYGGNVRDNGAVSGHEIELRDDQIIISRTDVRGQIVYVNPDFTEISGYSETELLGQPHNVVRHPDMPREVFADLWSDLNAGRPWVGLIKNRCKNGDAYWVEAHISPILDNGVISGFMSMRRKATPIQIAEAEKNYATLRASNTLDKSVFLHGRLIKTNWQKALLTRFNNASLTSKFILSSLIAAIIVLTATTYFLANHVSEILNENAHHQLRHDVSLVRTAFTARIDGTTIEVVEYGKTLSERVYDALGGRTKASRESLLALTKQAATSQRNPIEFFTSDLRGFATVFVLTPKGLQRQLTSLLDENGRPATGTYLAVDHPAHALLLAGKPYVGPAHLFGRLYLTNYLPIFDAKGAVIGATIIGIDLAIQLKSLKEQIRAMEIGKTGYYYIVDATPGPYFGTVILHPFQEGKLLTSIRDQSGRDMLAEMAQKRQGEIDYLWKNAEAGEPKERLKMVIFATLDNPQWIIAGGSAIDEFTALSKRVVLLVVAAGLTMVGVIFVIILVLLRKLVLRPLNTQVLPTFNAMSAGRFDTPLDVSGYDEMAQVVQGLESLRNRLAFESERERTLSRLHEKARQEAESLSRARAEFLANMSHEIRTPLNAVIGLAYLLNKSNLGQRDLEYVKRIEGAGKLLLSIVNDILDFSKIDAGKLHLEEASFRLDDVLENLSNLLRTRVQEKGLVLDYVVGPDVPQGLRGDALRLSQILINLVSNAIKFTAAGSITLFVNATPRPDNRTELEFRVQDTGIGMSSEQISNLFRAFSQGDSSITRKFGGTGLGLIISKRLVEMMGGTLWVDSHPQAGSIFGFTVWLSIDDATAPTVARSGYRVLVVDDNALARKVLERLLVKLGCIAHSVDSGEAALAELRDSESAQFDCVMVDLNMPNMDGLALGHHIRAEGGHLIKLVMVTSENVHDSPYTNALGDFDEVVEKPVTAARIGEVLMLLQEGKKRKPVLPGRPPAPLAGLRILVAEDIPTNQLIMRDLLESLGATINVAGNGQFALQQLAASGDNIDLILMDIQMPDMDGLEATRRIRAGQVHPDIPIIALTAHALDEERQRASHAGMNDFLTKPIEPAQLIEVINRWKPQRVLEASPPVSSQQPARDAFPAKLPGIDIEEGLHRMLNRWSLYEKVLRDFHARFSGETGRIRDALAVNDIETATRLAHSLKGTGAMISATTLAASAAELEQAIKSASPEQTACLNRLDQALSQVLDGIKSAFNM